MRCVQATPVEDLSPAAGRHGIPIVRWNPNRTGFQRAAGIPPGAALAATGGERYAVSSGTSGVAEAGTSGAASAAFSHGAGNGK